MPMAIPIVASAFAAASAAAATFGATLIGASGLGAALSAWGTVASVVSLGASLLAKPPKIEGQGQTVQTQLAGSASSLPIIFGETAVGGQVFFQGVGGGSKNPDYFARLALSVGPIERVSAIYTADRLTTFATNPTRTGTSTGLSDFASAEGLESGSKLYKGGYKAAITLGEWDDTRTLNQMVGGGASGAGADGKTSGLATATFKLTQDAKNERFPNGVPSWLFIARGVKIYDPRFDSTFPGGSGPQRLDDATTHAWSDCPPIVALNYALGRYVNGKKLWGIGASWDEIDVQSFVNAANVADVNHWNVGGLVTSGDDRFAVLSQILAAGGAVPIVRGAQLACYVNFPKTSVFTLEQSDIVGSVKLTTTNSLRERFSRVVPKYREPNARYQQISGEAVSADTYVSEDNGNVRSEELDLALVDNATTAKQLAAYFLVNSREFVRLDAVCGPRLLAVQVGEAITVNIAEVAVANQKMVVLGRDFDAASQTVSLNLISETDGKHDFALGLTAVAPPSPTVSTFDPSLPSAPGSTSWAVTATSIVTSTGVSQPALVVEGANDSLIASKLLFSYRLLGATDWTGGYDLSPAATRVEITGLSDGGQYQVAVQVETAQGAISPRMILPTATVGATLTNVVPGGVDWGSRNTGTSPLVNVPPALTTGSDGRLQPGNITVGSGTLASWNATVTTALANQDVFNTTNATVTAALAAADLVIEANLQAADTRLTAADTALTTAQTALGTAISGVDSRLTTAQSALNTAVTDLDNRLDSAEATVLANGSRLTSVEGRTTAVETGKTSVTDFNALKLRTDTAEGTLVAHGGQLTTISTDLAGKATASSVTDLATRVTTAEGVNTAQNTRLSTAESNIAGKASASDLASLTARVSTTETTNAAQNTRLSTVESDITTKASASDLATLSGRVTTNTGDINSTNTRLDTVESTVAGKASASSLSDLAARVTSTEGTNAAQNSRLSTVESDVSGKASATDLTNLTARVSTTEGTNAAQNSRLSTVETDVAGKASATDVSALTGRVTSAEGTLSSQNTRIGTVESSVGTKAAASDVAALTGRVGTAEGSISSQNTRLGSVESTVAGKASATDLLNLQARSVSDALNDNASFGKSWASGSIPPDWTEWSAGGQNTIVTGQVSPNAVQLTANANQDVGFSTLSGGTTLARGRVGAGWYVLEATVTLNSGQLLGSGLHVQFTGSDPNNTVSTYTLNFATDADSSDAAQGAGTAGRTYRFSKLINPTNTGIQGVRLYVMAGWSGIGSAVAAKVITFHEAKIRPANASEIQIGKAISGGTSLTANLTNLNTVTTNLATNKAEATRVATIEAKAASFPNLLKNSDFSQKPDKRGWPAGTPSAWTVGYNQNVGSYIGRYVRETNSVYLISDSIPIYPGQTYSISFNGDGGDGVNSGDGTAVYCSQYDSGGNYISDGDGYLYVPVNSRDWSVRQGTSGVSHPNAHFVKIAIRKGTQTDGLGVSRIMLNSGSTQVNWNDAATVGDASARVSSVETATTDGRFATASRASALEARSDTLEYQNGLRIGETSSLSGRVSTVEQATTDGRFATATRATALEARANTAALSLPNLIKNADFANGTAHWTKDHAGTFATYYHSTLGTIAYWNGSVPYVLSENYPFGAGDALNLSFEGDGGGSGFAYVQFLPSYASTATVAFPAVWGQRAKLENQIAPSGTTGFRLVFDKGSASQVHLTRVKVNTGSVAVPWSNEATGYDTNARIGTVETATTDGRFATASRASALEARAGTLETENGYRAGETSSLSGRVSTVEQATTDGRFAAASTVTALTSRVASGSSGTTFNRNVTFSDYPTSTGIPTGWSAWADCRDQHRETPGLYGDYAFWQHNNLNGTIGQCGLWQNADTTPTMSGLSGGYYVLEADVRLDAGQIGGAGVYFALESGPDASISFATEKPVNIGETVIGVGGTVGTVYSFRKLVYLNGSGNGRALIYAMTDWQGFDGTRRPKVLRWYRCAFRLATTAEIASQRADSNADLALAQISTESSTRASADSALASRATTIEALTRTIPNKLVNSDGSAGSRGWALGDWFASTDPNVGSVFFTAQAGNQYAVSDLISVYPNQFYCFSFEGDGGSNPAQAGVYFQECNSAGVTINDGVGFRNFTNVGWFEGRKAGQPITTGANTYFLRAVLWKGNATSYTYVSRIMLTAGHTQVNWTDQATARDNVARITSTESVASDAQGKVNAKVGVTLDVNGYVSGYSSVNNGTTAAFTILADRFQIVQPGSTGARTEYIGGIWYCYTADNAVRSMWGKPFGSELIVSWTGPNSVGYGSETKANAYVYTSMIAPRFGGSDVTGGASSSKVKTFNSSAGAASIQITTTVASIPYQEWTVTINGGVLDANSDLTGYVEIFENNGSGWVSLGTMGMTVPSSGLTVPGGGYAAEASNTATLNRAGTQSGAMTYQVNFTRTGGSNYVTGATIDGLVKLTPIS